jgi:hypothetical protein
MPTVFSEIRISLDQVPPLLTNRFFLCSVVDRTMRKRFLAQWVIPLWGEQVKPEHRRLFTEVDCSSLFAADALSWRTIRWRFVLCSRRCLSTCLRGLPLLVCLLQALLCEWPFPGIRTPSGERVLVRRESMFSSGTGGATKKKLLCSHPCIYRSYASRRSHNTF